MQLWSEVFRDLFLVKGSRAVWGAGVLSFVASVVMWLQSWAANSRLGVVIACLGFVGGICGGLAVVDSGIWRKRVPSSVLPYGGARIRPLVETGLSFLLFWTCLENLLSLEDGFFVEDCFWFRVVMLVSAMVFGSVGVWSRKRHSKQLPTIGLEEEEEERSLMDPLPDIGGPPIASQMHEMLQSEAYRPPRRPRFVENVYMEPIGLMFASLFQMLAFLLSFVQDYVFLGIVFSSFLALLFGIRNIRFLLATSPSKSTLQSIQQLVHQIDQSSPLGCHPTTYEAVTIAPNWTLIHLKLSAPAHIAQKQASIAQNILHQQFPHLDPHQGIEVYLQSNPILS